MKLVSLDLAKSLIKLARATGLEPATSGVTGRHSNQLSYARAMGRRRAAISGAEVRAGPAGVKLRE